MCLFLILMKKENLIGYGYLESKEDIYIYICCKKNQDMLGFSCLQHTTGVRFLISFGQLCRFSLVLLLLREGYLRIMWLTFGAPLRFL